MQGALTLLSVHNLASYTMRIAMSIKESIISALKIRPKEIFENSIEYKIYDIPDLDNKSLNALVKIWTQLQKFIIEKKVKIEFYFDYEDWGDRAQLSYDSEVVSYIVVTIYIL